MATYYSQSEEQWNGTLGLAARALLKLENDSGAFNWFRHSYTQLIIERDAYAEEKGLDSWKLKINAGMLAKRMLENKLKEYKGAFNPAQSWCRIK